MIGKGLRRDTCSRRADDGNCEQAGERHGSFGEAAGIRLPLSVGDSEFRVNQIALLQSTRSLVNVEAIDPA
jgi:hypothetical protein